MDSNDFGKKGLNFTEPPGFLSVNKSIDSHLNFPLITEDSGELNITIYYRGCI